MRTSLDTIRTELLRLKWQLAALRFERALHRHALAVKAYNPEQPRDKLGRWTDTGGGGSGGLGTRVAGPGAGRGRGRGSDFPGATPGQLIRLENTIARTENAVAQIRQYDPNWRPGTESLTAPGSIEGAIGHAQARMIETEAHLTRLRSGIGGNLGPPLEPMPRVGSGPSPARAFDGPSWIEAYRAAHNTRDLFGNPTWKESDTVAVTDVGGSVVFGVNSSASGYTATDRANADSWRGTLVNNYPDVMAFGNIGGLPNDALYHAETTTLIRSAEENGGTLAGRDIEVYVNRPLCWSCGRVLPLLGRELGNPTVTFIDPAGVRQTMRDGYWLP